MSVEAQRHIAFFKAHLHTLHPAYTSLDISRMNVLYFALSGLDLWGGLDSALPEKQPFIDWIYAQQVGPHERETHGGFRGGPHLGLPFDCTARTTAQPLQYNSGHLAMTYTALASLRILGDDFGRVHRESIFKALRQLQLPDGSFRPQPGDCESDVRFVFCACAISFFLQDWSGVDKESATRFIRLCQSYDGGFSQAPGQESHGGSTYCALASLALMGKLTDFDGAERALQWCLMRLENGFQGRISKLPDSCYSFWVGGSIQILDGVGLCQTESLLAHLLQCQGSRGGFAKHPDHTPDILHSYFGSCGLSIFSLCDFVRPVFAPLGISVRAADLRFPSGSDEPTSKSLLDSFKGNVYVSHEKPE